MVQITKNKDGSTGYRDDVPGNQQGREIKCPHCHHGKRTAPYAPAPYPCEDCDGTGVLKVCEECQQAFGPRDFEEPEDAVCGYCKVNAEENARPHGGREKGLHETETR